MNRDWLPNIRTVLQVAAHLIFDMEFALLLQYHDRHGSELLGKRADAEFGLGGVRDFILAIGEAVAFAEDHLTVLGDQDRTAEEVRFGDFLKYGIKISAE